MLWGRYRAIVVAAGTCLALTGCFRYVRVEPAVVRPHDDVQVQFTDEAAIRLAREFGRITESLEGRIPQQRPDSLSISVWIGRDYQGTQFGNVHQTVFVGREEVAQVRRRQFSLSRTALVASGTLVVFAVLVSQIFQQEDPNVPRDGTTTPPPPPDPFFIRIRIGSEP